MPYARDTLTALRSRTLSDLATRLPGANPFQRRTALNVIGTTLAGALDDEYGYLDWLARNAVPFTAAGEYLIGWAGLRGVTLKGATNASGNVVFSGNPGAAVFAAQQISNGGQTYVVTAGGIVGVSGTVSVAVGALIAGAAGNLDPGAALGLVTPSSGLTATATVDAGGLAGGADPETLDELRNRMLQRYAAPPQGGDLDDYAGWASAVPGITRAWCYSGAGAGAVVVYFMMDDVRVAGSGLPQGQNGKSRFESRGSVTAAGDQLVVADRLYAERSAGALVYACAPTARPLPLILAEVPQDTAIRAGIVAALAGLLRREAAPGGVVSRLVLPNGSLVLAPGGVVRVSHLEDAIAAVPGLDHFELVSPTADIVVGIGEISVPGAAAFL